MVALLFSTQVGLCWWLVKSQIMAVSNTLKNKMAYKQAKNKNTMMNFFELSDT